MPLDSVRILDLDGSVCVQEDLIRSYQPAVIDLRDLGPACRLWLDARHAALLSSRLDPRAKNAVTLLGSGDFHHLSALLIEQFQQPLSVVVFDFHPDWNILPPRLGCGSWVSYLLRKEHIKKVVLLGVSSGDLDGMALLTGNLQALREDRLEIYTYAHQPSRPVFRDVPGNCSCVVLRRPWYNTIYWQELLNKNREEFVRQLVRRLPTQEVYVSIDKDCLTRAYALTNWEEGRLSLEDLSSMLTVMAQGAHIAGADIVGEYSPPRFDSALKGWCSRADHPKAYSARGLPAETVRGVNEKTNRAILSILLRPPKKD